MKPIRATLTKKQKDFLFSYFPKDNMFTSQEELDKIAEVFELNNGKSEEWYRLLRNAVVEYYHPKIDRAFRYMYSMQSVTTVIDYYKVKKGYQV